MVQDYRNISDSTIKDARSVQDKLIEKALALRCSSYLAQIKSKLLTGTIYEINSSKKALLSINARLEREVAERAQAEEMLQKSRDEAEQTTRLKDKFITLVSHDLKNPLGAVIGYISFAHAMDGVPDAAREMLDQALSTCCNMNDFINEILSLDRIKGSRLEPECARIDIEKTVTAVIESHGYMSSTKGVVLINEVPPGTQLEVDEKLMLVAIGNLVSNAIKFCREGDRVRIAYQDVPHPTLLISDTGIGIGPEVINALFQYEEKTSTRGTAGEVGTGLGLPLTHDIIEAHGADLRLESTPGKGTTFYIIFNGTN